MHGKLAKNVQKTNKKTDSILILDIGPISAKKMKIDKNLKSLVSKILGTKLLMRPVHLDIGLL